MLDCFESIVKTEIYDRLNLHHLLCTDEHGFVPERSCITQMLIAMDYWTKGLEQRISIDVVYLDFSKGFDSVPHTCLLIKLQGYGICGDLYIGYVSILLKENSKVNHLVGSQ